MVAFMKGLNNKGDKAFSTGTLSCRRTTVIIIVCISRGGAEDEEFEELGGEAISTWDCTEGKTVNGSGHSSVVDEVLEGGQASCAVVGKGFTIELKGTEEAGCGRLIRGKLKVKEPSPDRTIEAVSSFVQFMLAFEGTGAAIRCGGGDCEGGDKAVSTFKGTEACKELTAARLTVNVSIVAAVKKPPVLEI